MSIRQIIRWETSNGDQFDTEDEARRAEYIDIVRDEVNASTNEEIFDFDYFQRRVDNFSWLREAVIVFAGGPLPKEIE